jgi:hypothetical protein
MTGIKLLVNFETLRPENHLKIQDMQHVLIILGHIDNSSEEKKHAF